MINLGSNSSRVDKNLLQVSSLATSNSCDIADHQHQHQHRHHQHHQGHHRSSDGDEHSPDDAARAAAASAAQAQASAAATAFNRAWLAKTAKQNLSESCVLKAATQFGVYIIYIIFKYRIYLCTVLFFIENNKITKYK